MTIILFTGFAYSTPTNSINSNKNSLQEITFSQVEQLSHRDHNKTNPDNSDHKPRCIHEAYTACYNNDLYRFNSCGKREKLELKCPKSKTEWGPKYCKEGNVYQDYTKTTSTCIQHECASVTGSNQMLIQDCLNAGCTNGKCNIQPKIVRTVGRKTNQIIQ